ncbi:hypothetical protein BDZ91DRAFT_668029 [Kalaharituber pfeilii]|nr:hypothetical protein BDZ91DRAFT_668029 [Kalaharituber pfeilii]
MEIVEAQTGEGNGVTHTGEDSALIASRMAFLDYLKSPIITLLIGPPERETALTAHQLFLSRSPFFQNIFSASPTPTVSLPDEDLDAMGCFLQFLYTGEYFPRIIKSRTGEEHLEKDPTDPNSSSEIDEDGAGLLKHAKVYTLAEKLGLAELKHLAHAKIHRINSTAKGELAYARFVYANTPREDTTIRAPIASFWAHRSHILRHEAEDEFRRMVLEFPQFAYDILSMVLDQKEKGSKDKDKDDGTSGGLERSKPGRKRPRLSTLS